MVVSLNWLKEYVNLGNEVSVKEIVDKLTMTGSKVETYEKFGEETEKVYTAKVEKIEAHPQEETLKILSLSLGDRTLTAVAKIPDIEVGNIIPVALPGAKIIGKEVEVSEVKGITSECMVCHVLDLGLDLSFPWVKPSGLLCFPQDVALGKEVNSVLGLGDYIIEFEITPNRPDCLSVEGLAKELALTFGVDSTPLWKEITPKFHVVDTVENLGVKIETDNCQRYVMNVVDQVEIKPAPYEMQLKLIKSGIRPINNMVDITNYIMLEMGQPLHAFDYEELQAQNIVVRQAKVGEKLQTLDGVDRILDTDAMVITDGEKPVGLAGIMGGELSGINENTKKVVIEAAAFVRGNVRNTSKKQQLRSDASSRYEKGLPKELPIHAMNRVCDLVNGTYTGVMGKNVVDVYPEKQTITEIVIDYDKINRIIGIELDHSTIDKLLKSAGIEIHHGKACIPYDREDIELVEDLSEEVARIYGYDKLPSTLPKASLTFGEKTVRQKQEEKIKMLAMACGYNEIYTYTFFNSALLDKMGVEPTDSRYRCVTLSNPLSQDFENMRTTTMPLMLEALERNYTRKVSQAKLFELGRVFLHSENINKGKLCEEEQILTLGSYDEISDFYDMKEAIDNILGQFHILDLEYDIERITNKREYHPGISARIKIGEDIIAEFGKISPKIRGNYMLPENTYIASIYFEALTKYAKKEVTYKELPKYPAVERDIAFIVDADILSHHIEKALKKIDTVETVELFDVYQGKQIEQGKKSMAYALQLRSPEKTLEETEITKAMQEVVSCLQENFGAKVRE